MKVDKPGEIYFGLNVLREEARALPWIIGAFDCVIDRSSVLNLAGPKPYGDEQEEAEEGSHTGEMPRLCLPFPLGSPGHQPNRRRNHAK
jgi:hypothetical protein